MSTNVDTAQKSGFQSWTRSAFSHVKDPGVLSKVKAVASLPACVFADAVRGPVHAARQLVSRRTPEVTVFERTPPSPDVRKMVDRCVKVVSSVQTLGPTNNDRVKYNRSVIEAVQDFSKYAAKHNASDCVDVLRGMRKDLNGKFGQESVCIENVDYPTVSTQLYGLPTLKDKILVRGFLIEASSIVLQKAVEELRDTLSSDPLSDKAIPVFKDNLQRLKKLGLLTQEQINKILSGDSGREVAQAFLKASEQLLSEASVENIPGYEKTLNSRSAALSAAFGLKGLSMPKVFKDAQESRQATLVAQEADVAQEKQMTAEQREHLENRAHELEERLSLEQKVNDAQKKVKDLEFQLKSLRKTPTDKMSKLIKKLQANPTEEALIQLLQELDAAKAEVQQELKKVRAKGKQNLAIQAEIKKLESALQAARDELTQSVKDLAEFKKAHKMWSPCPQFLLKRVQAQLAQFEEGAPVQVGPTRRSWVAPAIIGGVTALTAAAVGGLTYFNPSIGGVQVGSAIVNGAKFAKHCGLSVCGKTINYVRKIGLSNTGVAAFFSRRLGY